MALCLACKLQKMTANGALWAITIKGIENSSTGFMQLGPIYANDYLGNVAMGPRCGGGGAEYPKPKHKISFPSAGQSSSFAVSRLVGGMLTKLQSFHLPDINKDPSLSQTFCLRNLKKRAQLRIKENRRNQVIQAASIG